MKTEKNLSDSYNISLVKSNSLISARYKSSLLENQVMAVAMSQLQMNPATKSLEAKLYPGQLKKILSDDAHIYRDLKKLSNRLVGRAVIIEDGKGNFQAFSMVPTAIYEDGVLTIKFNEIFREHLFGLEKNFTSLNLGCLTEFQSNNSFRIYEVLKKDAYKCKLRKDGSPVTIEYRLSEFRFMIGVADSEAASIKKDVKNAATIDWDDIYENLDPAHKKHDRWKDFKERVLDTAQTELAAKSDIKFEYEGIREGKKFKRIRFYIYSNEPNKDVINKKKQVDSALNEQLEFPSHLDLYKPLYDEFVDHNELTKEDLDLLLKKSKYDVDAVREAIYKADKQPHIYNYMGWIIDCIQQGGYKTTETLSGSHEDAVAINNVVKQYETDKKTGEIARKAWERATRKDNFDEFADIVKMESGIEKEHLTVYYSYEDLMRMYGDFATGREIRFPE